MQIRAPALPRLAAAAFALFALFSADVTDAHAQAASCTRLNATLEQFNRNVEFRNLSANTQAARELARQVQNAESVYVRNGCNDAARAGRPLTPQCQGIAREVLRLREEAARAAQAVETGNAVARQREGILQEMARFGCGGGSSVTFSTGRQTLFERIFGSTPQAPQSYPDSQVIESPDYWGYPGSYRTVRTLCVRLSDGYFWPVSYATLPDYVANDAAQCQQMCPGTDVDLYFYDNPGEEPEQMRNQYGQPYSALPNAFRYREQFDANTSCRAPVAGGRITVLAGDGGVSRAMIEYGEASFPLPLRDPRRQAPVTVAALGDARFVDVPLPPRRPAAPGEAPPAQPVEDAGDGLRLVRFGDRVVRVVGPDTPYAQATAEAP